MKKFQMFAQCDPVSEKKWFDGFRKGVSHVCSKRENSRFGKWTSF